MIRGTKSDGICLSWILPTCVGSFAIYSDSRGVVDVLSGVFHELCGDQKSHAGNGNEQIKGSNHFLHLLLFAPNVSIEVEFDSI